MQILRLLAARRAESPVSDSERRDNDGDFYDLDFSPCSFRVSSSSSSSLSFSYSDDECTVHDFIISLQRSSSASPLTGGGAAAPLKFCSSDTPSKLKAGRKRSICTLRSLSFGAKKAVPLYGRPSFARSSSGRRSSSSARFVDLPSRIREEEHAATATQTTRHAPSRDVIRRCLARISRRIRTAASRRAAKAKGIHRLRKCRSGSSAAPGWVTANHDGESAVEKHDGIAGAIAHCKESLHRASTSECDSRLLRSRSE